MFPENTTGNDNCKMNTITTFEALKKNIVSFRIKESKWKLRPFWNSKQISQNRADISGTLPKSDTRQDHSYICEKGLGIRTSVAGNCHAHRFGALVGTSSRMTMMQSHW